ncbi:MAG: hypothetical protein Q7S74_05720 [Nanoarchaeota archaeon]|nr:hypothetical protein [Nanoarchaeota archaeon]
MVRMEKMKMSKNPDEYRSKINEINEYIARAKQLLGTVRDEELIRNLTSIAERLSEINDDYREMVKIYEDPKTQVYFNTPRVSLTNEQKRILVSDAYELERKEFRSQEFFRRVLRIKDEKELTEMSIRPEIYFCGLLREVEYNLAELDVQPQWKPNKHGV